MFLFEIVYDIPVFLFSLQNNIHIEREAFELSIFLTRSCETMLDDQYWIYTNNELATVKVDCD